MTRVILNLGLDGPTYGKSTMQRNPRMTAYMAELQRCMQHGASLEVRGDTVIIEGNLQFRGGATSLYKLAEAGEQDCVAAWFTDLQVGMLYGPYAAKWGDFNLEHFVLPT